MERKKRDTIKCVSMINDFSKGGIRVTDIRSKITGLKHVKATCFKRLDRDDFAR